MTVFHFAIISFCAFFLLGYIITFEVKRFITDKRAKQEYYCREFIRKNTNIDVK